MDFKNGVINIQAVGYNGARMVYPAVFKLVASFIGQLELFGTEIHVKSFLWTLTDLFWGYYRKFRFLDFWGNFEIIWFQRALD